MSAETVIKLSVGAIFSSIVAILGIKKIIKQEICEGIKPQFTAIQNEVNELKERKFMTEEAHKIICRMNAKYVDEKMNSTQNSIDLQITGIKEHIDAKFSELTRRLDRRRGSD